MRDCRKMELFPKLCRAFESEDELGEAINKCRTYISQRLNGKAEFTFRDKKLALAYIHEPIEQMSRYFPEREEGESA